jgi:hypothetical protein
MDEQRSEQDQCSVLQERYTQIKIAISAGRSVKVKYECGETQRGKMDHEWGSPTLPEQDKEPDEQVNEPNEVYVEISGSPARERVKVVKISDVVATFRRVRGSLD